MTKRLSYGWTAIVFGVIIFPSLVFVSWLQEEFSLPNWVWVILAVSVTGVATEIQHRIGPEGAFAPFIIPSSFSTKDKAVYSLSIITSVVCLMAFAQFWNKASLVMKVVFCVVITIFLFNIPVRLFGSSELRQILSRKKI